MHRRPGLAMKNGTQVVMSDPPRDRLADQPKLSELCRVGHDYITKTLRSSEPVLECTTSEIPDFNTSINNYSTSNPNMSDTSKTNINHVASENPPPPYSNNTSQTANDVKGSFAHSISSQHTISQADKKGHAPTHTCEQQGHKVCPYFQHVCVTIVLYC